MEIVLIRHGKPRSATNTRVNAADYVKWIRAYNFSDVADNSRPVAINPKYHEYFLVCSDLTRAIHSTKLYTQRGPDLVSSLFREMEIPRYKLPLTLNPMTWVYLCRGLWMLGFNGPFESYVEAKNRAQKATDELIQLAQKHERLVLFGHGFTNLHIRKQLIARGWALHNKSNGYWGESRLTSQSGQS